MAGDINRIQLLLYGLPALPLALLTLPVYIFLPSVYAGALGLPLAAIGLVLLFVRLFDAATDPLIGFLSDRVPLAQKRRKSYLALAVPVTVAAAWMLMRPPPDADIAYLGIWSTLLSLGWTLAIVPYNAWGAEMSTDYHERGKIVGVREALVVTGTVVAIAMPSLLAGDDESGGLRALNLIAILVAFLLPVLTLAALLGVPEPRDFGRKRLSMSDGLRQMRQNGPFIRLIAAFVVNGFANGLPASLFLFYTADGLAASPTQQGLLLLTYFLAGIAAIPIWLGLAKRRGKHKAWCIAMAVACAAFAFVPFLSKGDILAFGVICVITGAALGADLTLPASMQADVVDMDTAASGEQRSAVYFAAWGMATKLTLALAVGTALPLLSWFSYVPGTEAGLAITALAVLYAVVPTAFKMSAILLMWRFPLDEARQRAFRRQIEGG